jgi:hypothetical protein
MFIPDTTHVELLQTAFGFGLDQTAAQLKVQLENITQLAKVDFMVPHELITLASASRCVC